MNEKLVSIIVPVYNEERYLAPCLESILAQSYRMIELIVVNDGSNDLTQKIADTYAEEDQRVKVYLFEHEGLSEARNHGLSVATGDYIMFVDSDDELLTGSVEALTRLMSQTEADIAEGRIIKGKVKGKDTKNNKKKDSISKKGKDSYKIKCFSPEKAIEDLLYQHNLSASVCGKLFKREIFDELRFEKGMLYEDLNIIYLLFEKCRKIVYTDYPVYYYRDTDGSILNTWKPARLDVLDVTERIEEHISENYPEIYHAASDRRLSANFNMFALCSKHGEKEKASKCWETIKDKRKASLFNRRVRFKNKGGIILSYFGRDIFSMIARRVYR